MTDTTIINVKKIHLNKCQPPIKDFQEWISHEKSVYIGRNMSFYVPGAIASKWANPFTIKKYGLEKCLELYEEYIKNTPELYDSLIELQGKELGCWCKPNKCHGDILIKLINQKYFQ